MSLSIPTRRPRGVFLSIIVLVCALLGVSLGAAPAKADTNGVSDVYMNLGDSPTSSQARQYSLFIQSLRNAAGHQFRGGIYQSQYTQGGLIRLGLTHGDDHITLWLAPQNLYVMGFTNRYGQTFAFNDLSGLFGLMRQNNINPGTNSVLGFGGGYISLSGQQGANRGRGDMPVSYNDLIGSLTNLSRTTNPFGNNARDVARSLMFMIQYTSESARFHDIYQTMLSIHSSNVRYSGLSMFQQELENAWDPISLYGQAVSANPNAPARQISGIGWLRNFGDVARYVALLLASTDSPQLPHLSGGLGEL